MAPITPAIVKEGEHLATFEGAEYYALPVVYRINKDGEMIFYCTRREWPRTEIGRMSGLIEEVQELKRRNAELEERLEIAQGFIDIKTQVDALPDLEEDADTLLCSCGRRFADNRALSAHQRRAAIHRV